MKKIIIILFIALLSINLAYSLTAQFRPQFPIGDTFYYNSTFVKGNYTRMGTSPNSANLNYFMNGVKTDDAFAFYTSGNGNTWDTTSSFGKYGGITLNISTPVTADVFNIVWEYARYNSTLSWANYFVPFENVTDSANGACINFTYTGNCTIWWNIPDDWENYVGFYYNTTTNVYYKWLARARINYSESISAIPKQGKNNMLLVTNEIKVDCNQTDDLTMSWLAQQDDLNDWNVITNVSNVYSISAQLVFTGLCNWETVNELIQFENCWMPFNTGTINMGALYADGKAYNGSTIIFKGKNCDYNDAYLARNTNGWANISASFYNSKLIVDNPNGNGLWGGGVGSTTNTKITDLYVQGFRQLSLSEKTNVITDVKMYNTQVESPGATMVNVNSYGKSPAYRPSNSNKEDWVHRGDFTGVPAGGYAVNPYLGTIQNWTFNTVDCNYGTLAKSNWGYWNYPSVNNSVRIWTSVLLKAKTSDGTGIYNATLNITNRFNDSFIFQSNEDGYFYWMYSGNISSSNPLNFTDTDINFSNQTRWHEIFITSGNDFGDRKVIHFKEINSTWGNTLKVHAPWIVNPATGSRFTFIPYIQTALLVPINAHLTSSYSNFTDYNNFTFTFSKDGYKTISYKKNIYKPIDEEVLMEEQPAWNYSNPVKFSIENTSTVLFAVDKDGNFKNAGNYYPNTNATVLNALDCVFPLKVYNQTILCLERYTADLYLLGERKY